MKTALAKLNAGDAETVLAGLSELEDLMQNAEPEQFTQAVEAISGLFYIDPYDRPDLKPVVDRASEILAANRSRTLEFLVEKLTDADIKFGFNVARTLGLMGAAALGKLIQAFENTDDTAGRSFIVYAIGKIKDPVLVEAIPLLLQASGDSNREVRDSAVRTIGKLAEVVPAERVSPHELQHLVDALFRAAGDRAPAVRAKAVRSLGKMAGFGFLDEENKKALQERIRRILGLEDAFNWDLAYIVRKEAQFALEQLER